MEPRGGSFTGLGCTLGYCWTAKTLRFWLSRASPSWGKALAVGMGKLVKLVVDEIQKQKETTTRAKAVSQAKHVQWMSAEKMKLSWRVVSCMEAGRIRFMLGATYDVLPSPQNLSKWIGKDPACPQCSGIPSLWHALSGSKTSLSQGQYTWRQNQALKCLAAATESMW